MEYSFKNMSLLPRCHQTATPSHSLNQGALEAAELASPSKMVDFLRDHVSIYCPYFICLGPCIVNYPNFHLYESNKLNTPCFTTVTMDFLIMRKEVSPQAFSLEVAFKTVHVIKSLLYLLHFSILNKFLNLNL